MQGGQFLACFPIDQHIRLAYRRALTPLDHGLGHSVGIEIHEAPNANPNNEKPLPEGAVVTAEPGIYIPGSYGIRIEDMVLVRKDGCANLTLAPKQLEIL